MGTDGGSAGAAVYPAGEERGGACTRCPRCQVRLAAGAVVEAHRHRAVAVCSTHDRTFPVEGQVPACPGLLDFRLDLRKMDEEQDVTVRQHLSTSPWFKRNGFSFIIQYLEEIHEQQP